MFINPVEVLSPVIWEEPTELNCFMCSYSPEISSDYPEVTYRDASKYAPSDGHKPSILLCVVEIEHTNCDLVAPDVKYFVLDDCEPDNLVTWLKTMGVGAGHQILQDINPALGNKDRKSKMRNFCKEL